MRLFQPSPAFVAFFNQVIADAERPVTQGSYILVIPTFADPHEQAFADTKLAALGAQIHAMKQSVTPDVQAAAQVASIAAQQGQSVIEYQMWLAQQQSQGGP